MHQMFLIVKSWSVGWIVLQLLTFSRPHQNYISSLVSIEWIEKVPQFSVSYSSFPEIQYETKLAIKWSAALLKSGFSAPPWALRKDLVPICRAGIVFEVKQTEQRGIFFIAELVKVVKCRSACPSASLICNSGSLLCFVNCLTSEWW